MDEKKNKFRKRFIAVLSTVSIISLVTSIVASIYLFRFVKDYSTIPFSSDIKTSKEELANKKIFEAYKDLVNKTTFQINVDEFDINSLLNNYLDNIKKDTSWGNKVKKIGLETKSDKYVLTSENSFNTRVYLTTSKTTTNEELSFHIDEAKFSKMDYKKLFSKIYKSYINDSSFTKLFNDLGLSIKTDLANDSFTYKLNDFESDFLSDDIFSSLIKDSSTSFNNESVFSITGEVTSFNEKSLIDESKYDPKDISSLKVIVKDLCKAFPSLNNKEKDLMEYFLKGSKKSPSDILNILSNIDLSFFGIDDVNNYDGVFPSYDVDLVSEVKNDSESRVDTYLNDKVIALINEDTINKLFKSSWISGTTFIRKLNNDFIYISLNDLEISLEENAIEIYSSLTVNDVSYPLFIKFRNENNSKYKMNLMLTHIYVGNNSIRNTIKDIKGVIKEALEMYDFISFNNDNMEINFTSMIDPNMKSAVEAFSGNVDIEIKNSNIVLHS